MRGPRSSRGGIAAARLNERIVRAAVERTDPTLAADAPREVFLHVFGRRRVRGATAAPEAGRSGKSEDERLQVLMIKARPDIARSTILRLPETLCRMMKGGSAPIA